MEYLALSERECRAIRYANGPFGETLRQYQYHNDSFAFRDRDGRFEIPRTAIWDYLEAWKRSGLWSLHGRST